MELVDVATFFDRTPILDADTLVQLFLGQLQPFDDSHRDNAVAYRRVMSVAPGTAMPASRVVNAMGKTWLLGRDNPDGLETMNRQKYVIQSAAGKASVYTPAQFLAAAGAAAVWCDLQWVADRKELAVSSSVPQEYTAYLPRGSTAAEHSFIVLGSQCLLVQNSFLSPAGYVEAHGILQEAYAPTTATLTPRTFSSAAGGYTDGTPVTVACAIVRWQEWYRYAGQSDEKFQEGDVVLLLPVGTAATPSGAIVAAGKTYSVLTARADTGVLAVHGRPR